MEDNGGKKGKGHQGTCIKEPLTKSKRGRIEDGRWGWLGRGKVVMGSWRQLYLNNNKKKLKQEKKKFRKNFFRLK